MVAAIIGGTGVYDIPGVESEEVVVDTEYGQTAIHQGLGDASDLIFMARHGVSHNVPPHKVNYRANIKALQLCGVKRVVALFAVGSMPKLRNCCRSSICWANVVISTSIPPALTTAVGPNEPCKPPIMAPPPT